MREFFFDSVLAHFFFFFAASQPIFFILSDKKRKRKKAKIGLTTYSYAAKVSAHTYVRRYVRQTFSPSWPNSDC